MLLIRLAGLQVKVNTADNDHLADSRSSLFFYLSCDISSPLWNRKPSRVVKSDTLCLVFDDSETPVKTEHDGQSTLVERFAPMLQIGLDH